MKHTCLSRGLNTSSSAIETRDCSNTNAESAYLSWVYRVTLGTIAHGAHIDLFTISFDADLDSKPLLDTLALGLCPGHDTDASTEACDTCQYASDSILVDHLN